MAKFTTKERLFVKAYLANGGNGTKAAQAAGYSKQSARSIASENLTKPHIKAKINFELAKREKDLEKAAEMIGITKVGMLRDLHQVASANIDDFVKITRGERTEQEGEPDEEGNTHQTTIVENEVQVLAPEERRAGSGKLIKKISSGKYGPSIELESKDTARQLICKMLGWTKDKIEVGGEGGGPIAVQLVLPPNGREVVQQNPDEPESNKG